MNLDKRLAPFSGDYIAMCRRFNLRRDWKAGDWYVVSHKDGPYQSRPLVSVANDELWPSLAPFEEATWLPRLDQLLALLDANRHPMTLLSLAGRGWICKSGGIDNNGTFAPTAEEATLAFYLSTAGHLLEKGAE